MIPIIRDYYSKVIDAPYPIVICESKELENENRLRHLENIIYQMNNINNRTIKEIFGHEKVEKIEFDDGTDINVNGIFIAQGTADSTDIAKKIGLVLENNKIKVNENMETNIKGIYACGDCIGGILQISKAVNDGMKTGLNVIKFLK